MSDLLARAATIPLTVTEPVPCHCGEVTLPVGVFGSICDGGHHAPAECKRCPA